MVLVWQRARRRSHNILLEIPVVIVLLSWTLPVKGEISVFVLALVAYNSEIVIPAMDIAAKEINELYPDIKFNHSIFLNPKQEVCDIYENLMSHYASEFYYRQRPRDSYLVILPTGCSTSIMAASELAREWNVPVIASAGIDGRLANKKRFPGLIRMLPSQNVAYARTLEGLFRLYNWSTIFIICDPKSTTDYFFDSMCKEVPNSLQSARGRKYTFTVLSTNLSRSDLVTNALTSAKGRSRVIVLLAHMDLMRKCLIRAASLDMMTDDYVYTTVVFQNVDFYLWGSPNWFRNDSDDEIARKAFNSLLLVSIAHVQHNPKIDGFLETIRTAALEDFNKTADLSGEKYAYPLCTHTAFRALAEMINETLVMGRDLSDGAAIAKRMYNRSFESVDRPFRINANGDRDAAYTISGIDRQTGLIEELMMFDAYDNSINPNYFKRTWTRANSIPPDRPYCGYDGEDIKCQKTGLQRPDVQLYTALGLSGIVILLASFLAVKILRRKWTKEVEEKIVKIGPDEIYDFSGHDSTLHLKSVRNASGKRVMFRNHVAWCKATANFRQKEILTKLARHRLIERSRLDNINIVKFYGVCLTPDDRKYLVEYAAKGSLHDVISAESISELSTDIKFSFIHGIVSGLEAVHDSAVKVHGRLNTITCLVDQRLTLKLNNINLPDPLRPLYERYHGDPDKSWRLLYVAPELLSQLDFPDSRSTIDATQSADVYAFSIVAHQILFQCGPFQMPDPEQPFTLPDHDLSLNCRKQLVNDTEFRPPFPLHHKQTQFVGILSNCWAQDPVNRPTVKQLHKTLRGINGFIPKRNLMDTMIHRLKVFADELEDRVEEKTKNLGAEKEKTLFLLHQIMPKSIVASLQRGIVLPPEYFDEVTISFTAVNNFSDIVTDSTPFDVVSFLNGMFNMLDDIIATHDVYKVETIADSYMVASGLPQRNANRHSLEVAQMAIRMITAAKEHIDPVNKGEPLQLKIGINTGPCAASIVGTKSLRYCLFGDTINTASRMVTFGEALRIHLSSTFFVHVEKALLPPKWQCVYRGKIDIKGKGKMKTYWLEKTSSSNPLTNEETIDDVL